MIDIYLCENNVDLEYLYSINSDQKIKTIDYQEHSIMSIYKEYFSNSLFDESYVLIITNPIFLINKTNKLKKKEEEVFNQIVEVQSKNKLIFVIDKPLNNKIDYLKGNYKNINYVTNLRGKADKYFFENENITIDNEALVFLKENIQEGYDYIQEIRKLDFYKRDEENKEITLEDVRKFVPLKINVTIFLFIEKIILGENAKAYDIYNTLKEEEKILPEQVLALIYSQLRFFIQVKLLRNKRLSDNQIVSKLKCSPYRIKFSNSVISKTPLNTFIHIHNQISKYDYLIKSGKTKEKDVILNLLLN